MGDFSPVFNISACHCAMHRWLMHVTVQLVNSQTEYDFLFFSFLPPLLHFIWLRSYIIYLALLIALSGNKQTAYRELLRRRKSHLFLQTAIDCSLPMSITRVKTSDKPKGLSTWSGESDKRERFKGDSRLLVIRLLPQESKSKQQPASQTDLSWDFLLSQTRVLSIFCHLLIS